jgi:signal transduction histidine kinase
VINTAAPASGGRVRRTRVISARWAIVFSLVGLHNDRAAAAERQKEVLTIHSTRRDGSIAMAIDREVPRVLSNGLRQTVDYYSEYLDYDRFAAPEYFRDFLSRKYAGHTFDVVIAVQDPAWQFLAAGGQGLFAAAPIVFFASESQPRLTNATGVFVPFNFGGSVALAKALQPDLRHLFVVTGASPRDRVYQRWIQSQLQPFERDLDISYLSGLAIPEVEARVSNLPAHSAVYHVIVQKDGAGHQFPALEALKRVASAASAPTYAWTAGALGRGVVGGQLFDPNLLASSLGQLALRVLRGEPASSIHASSPTLSVLAVDARQLRRWGIRESRVPLGTAVRFKEPTAWDRYRFYIVGTAMLVTAQGILIVGLAFQRTRRRRAEALAHASQQQLRASYGRIRDLAGRLLGAQEVERSRIARELHDDVGQQLALLTIDLELMGGLGSDPPVEVEQIAHEALERAHSIAKAVHALSHRLHPAKLRLMGLVASISGLQREFSRPNLTISFAHDNLPASLPEDVTVCVFRIVQEALQNVIKHSAATRVVLRLSFDERSLTLTIVDNGVGFDLVDAKSRGLGLASMAERIEYIGGTLTIKTRRHGGTRLEVAVPYRDRPAAESTQAAIHTETGVVLIGPGQ